MTTTLEENGQERSSIDLSRYHASLMIGMDHFPKNKEALTRRIVELYPGGQRTAKEIWEHLVDYWAPTLWATQTPANVQGAKIVTLERIGLSEKIGRRKFTTDELLAIGRFRSDCLLAGYRAGAPLAFKDQRSAALFEERFGPGPWPRGRAIEYSSKTDGAVKFSGYKPPLSNIVKT